MFKQVHSGWPKAIRSTQNLVNTGPTEKSKASGLRNKEKMIKKRGIEYGDSPGLDAIKKISCLKIRYAVFDYIKLTANRIGLQ